MNLVELLQRHDACDASTAWARSLDDQSPENAWRKCPRGDWLIWIAAELSYIVRSTVPFSAIEELIHV